MANVFSERAVLFSNLALLGLPTYSAIPEAYQGVTLDRTMFLGPSPNTKGTEVVLWFLFSRLDERTTNERFRHCWPAFDRKQSRELLAIAFHWLDQLKKDGHLWPAVAVRKSYLEDGHGDKLERILCAFSSYVLETVTKQALSQLMDDEEESLDSAIEREMEQFLAKAQYRQQITGQLSVATAAVEAELAQLMQQLDTLGRQKRILQAEDQSGELVTLFDSQRDLIDEARNRWKPIEDWQSGHKHSDELLQTSLVERRRVQLEGEALRVEATSEALRTWGSDWQPDVANPGAALNTSHLLQMWHKSYGTSQAPISSTLVQHPASHTQQLIQQHQRHSAFTEQVLDKTRERIQHSISTETARPSSTQRPKTSVFRRMPGCPTSEQMPQHPALVPLSISPHQDNI